MDLGIFGRKAIVCAASRGLGAGCAQALAEAGCELVVNGRDEASLAATAAEITRRTGAAIRFVAGDLNDAAVRARLIAACPDADILVNNNGGPPSRDFLQLTHADMLAGLEANMIAPIELIQGLIEGMAARGFGRIVNITSGSVKAPMAGLDLSSGARAGLTAFLAGAARKYARFNVTINQLLPGAFDTDRIASVTALHAKAAGVDAQDLRAARERAIPAGRYGSKEEFGQTCAFLASVHAGYITGQNILIDGRLSGRLLT